MGKFWSDKIGKFGKKAIHQFLPTMQLFHLESVQVIHAADWAICYLPIGSHYPILPPKFSHIHVSYIYTILYNAVLY